MAVTSHPCPWTLSFSLHVCDGVQEFHMRIPERVGPSTVLAILVLFLIIPSRRPREVH